MPKTKEELPKLYRQIHGRDGSCYFRSFDLGEWLRTYSATPLPEGVTYVPPQETTAGPKDRVILQLRRDLAEVKTARNCLVREVRDLRLNSTREHVSRGRTEDSLREIIAGLRKREYAAQTAAGTHRSRAEMWEKRHAAVVRERDSLYAKWEGADDHRIRMKEAAKESEAFTRNLQGQVGRISAICEKQKGALNAMAADIADQARHVLDLQARLDRRENKVKKLKAKLRKAKGSK